MGWVAATVGPATKLLRVCAYGLGGESDKTNENRADYWRTRTHHRACDKALRGEDDKGANEDQAEHHGVVLAHERRLLPRLHLWWVE